MTTLGTLPTPPPAAISEVASLFEAMRDLIGDGACDAALRGAKDLFPPQHPMEAARSLRQRAILLMAQSSDLRADRQSARRDVQDIQRAQSDLETRAREFLTDAQKFAVDGRVGAAEARRARMQIDQARSEIRSAALTSHGKQRSVSIFISYRRDDSREMTGFIAERLQKRFGGDDIFMDVDSIPFGVNFRAYIVSTLAKCKACLVIIGPQWVDASRAGGGRRIDDENDLVRIEVETAIKVGVPVVPLLIRDARMPEASQLPAALTELPMRNGTPIRPHPDFENDIERLVSRLEEQIG